MDNYRKIIRFLKKELLAEYSTSIRRLKLSDDLDGDCKLKDDKFLVRINRDLPEHEAIETALHEIAHVLSWGTETDHHGPKWGAAYSRVYRVFLKKFIENNA